MDAIETMLDDVEEQLEEEVHAEEYFVNVSEIGQLIQEAQANDEDADVPNMEDSSMSMDETIHMEYQDESTSSNAEHETQDLACRYCGYESAHSRDYLEHEGIHTGRFCFLQFSIFNAKLLSLSLSLSSSITCLQRLEATPSKNLYSIIKVFVNLEVLGYVSYNYCLRKKVGRCPDIRLTV